MNQQTPIIRARTPSSFHDEAYKRDAGHDALQQEFLMFLRGRSIAAIPERAAVHRAVEGEYPLYRRGQIVAYADACEILTVNLTTTVNLFEIKPRIETVFGIVRQVKSLLALARVSIRADQHYCFVIVPAQDPKIGDLRAEWRHTWAWGASFDLEGEDE